jgi:hypothetical protein
LTDLKEIFCARPLGFGLEPDIEFWADWAAAEAEAQVALIETSMAPHPAPPAIQSRKDAAPHPAPHPAPHCQMKLPNETPSLTKMRCATPTMNAEMREKDATTRIKGPKTAMFVVDRNNCIYSSQMLNQL